MCAGLGAGASEAIDHTAYRCIPVLCSISGCGSSSGYLCWLLRATQKKFQACTLVPISLSLFRGLHVKDEIKAKDFLLFFVLENSPVSFLLIVTPASSVIVFISLHQTFLPQTTHQRHHMEESDLSSILSGFWEHIIKVFEIENKSLEDAALESTMREGK